MKVMIVDDEELNRELFSDLFADEDGVEVMCCIDGQEALNNVEAFKPDVVILDIMMPNVDGFEACKGIRERQKDSPPKIIMVTGMAGDDVEKRGYDVGADRLYFKPININVLMSEVLG